MIDGYDTFQPGHLLDYGHVNSLRVAEVAWSWQSPKSASPAAGFGPSVLDGWRAVLRPLPRVRMVSKVTVSTAPGEDLKKTDVDTTALVSHPIELPPSAPGTAKLLADRPGKISVAVEVPQRQLLVLSESHHGGWHADVDGQPVPVEQVNGDFFGCVVEKGKHHVEFAFLPVSLRVGKMVSLASLCWRWGWSSVPESA